MAKFSKTLKSFEESDKGHVAVLFGLLAVPVLVLTSVAIDSTTVNAERARITSALDSAALSAVTNQNLNELEREAFASKVFYDNLGDREHSVKLTVLGSSNTRVALKATAELPRTFPIMDNYRTMTIADNSTAELTYGETVCMLALALEGEETFLVTGGAELIAPNCTVQVNSTDSRAAVAFAGGKAEAQRFCVSGGTPNSSDDWSGSAFVPFVNTECGAIADPYVDRVYAAKDSCENADYLSKRLSSNEALSSGITLKPGTYCGGLDLSNLIVTLEPGTYVMRDGPLIVAAGSNIDATAGVTFVMQGDTAVFQAKAGGAAKFKAPADGEFAGLAFFQDIHYNTKNFKTLPTGISSLDAGTNIHINGTVYLPEQKLNFKGGSVLSNEASSTSFIAYQVRLGEGSKVEVDVNSSAVGLPPIEPRSDDGARLSQ